MTWNSTGRCIMAEGLYRMVSTHMLICSRRLIRNDNHYTTETYDNIKMDLKEVGWDGRDWIDLAQDRDRWRAYVNAVMNLRVP
jgi:hypothetical protein